MQSNIILRCEHCDAVFTKRQALNRHKSNIHKKRVVIQCTICLKQFGRKDNFERHLISCSKKSAIAAERNSSLTCQTCNSSFKTKQHLTRHMQTSSHKRATGEMSPKKIVSKKTRVSCKEPSLVTTDVMWEDVDDNEMPSMVETSNFHR